MNYINIKKKLNDTQRKELRKYEVGKRLKDNERTSLYEWVAEGNSPYKNPFYVYDETGSLMDYVSAFRDLTKEHKISLLKELKEYTATIEDLTDEELNDLCEWVADGNSVYDNPCYISEDNGKPMNYIEAVRIMADMRENPENYWSEQKMRSYTDDIEIPF